MAVEYCAWCDRYVDLDYEDGYRVDDEGGYVCDSCAERLPESDDGVEEKG